MRKVTGSIGMTRIPKVGDGTGRPKLQRILICRPNHRLGNLLLITPLLRDVEQTLPDVRIDLFLKGSVAPVLFRNYRSIDRIILLPKKPLKNIFRYLQGWITIRKNRYDLVINVISHSSSGKLSARFTNSEIRFMGDIDDSVRSLYPDHLHMAKYPVYSFRNYIKKLGFISSAEPVPELDLRLSRDEIDEGRKTLRDLVRIDRQTIAIYTYATGAKCYSQEWWTAFYERLKMQYAECNIVEVLPIENISQIGFEAPSFYSRDLRKIGALLAGANLFIGADSGMMHLASAAHVPTVGLFKSDNMPVYAPFGNRSLGVNTQMSDIDEILRLLGRILPASDRDAAAS